MAPTGRHPELVSGSSWSCAPSVEIWTLKQVQGDELEVSKIRYSRNDRDQAPDAPWTATPGDKLALKQVNAAGQP
jgi:hypothetical protein